MFRAGLPTSRGKVPAVVAVAAVIAGAAAIAAAAVTATINTPKLDLLGETDDVGGLPPAPLPPPAPGSAVKASRVTGGTGGYTSIMQNLDSLNKSSTLPPP